MIISQTKSTFSKLENWQWVEPAKNDLIRVYFYLNKNKLASKINFDDNIYMSPSCPPPKKLKKKNVINIKI